MAVLRSVGHYQRLLELGQGGMGAAHLARMVGAGGFERLVVVKRLHAHLLNQPDAQRRFLDEARLAAYVHHANVVGVHQAGSDTDGQFIVLDYVEGGSLDEVVDRAALRGLPVPVPVVLRILVDALAGLQAIHDAVDAAGRPLRILHRDVSPQNILVGRDGVTRLADFGIAKSSIGSVSTDKGYIVGKLLYMPPEYLRRAGVDRRLDVYAMGMSMWVVLAGADPWPGADEAQMVTHIVSEGVPRITSAADVPPQVESIVSKACAMEPEDRYQSAREMSDAIEEVARFTGWMASHAEVAAFVEQLLGHDLAKRRERVVSVLRALGDTDAEQVALQTTQRKSTDPAADGRVPLDAVGTERQATGAALSFSSTSNRRHDRRWVPILLLAVGAMGAIVGLLLWQSHGRRGSGVVSPTAQTSPGASTPAGQSVETATPARAAESATAKPAPASAPTSTAPAVTPRRSAPSLRRAVGKPVPAPSPRERTPSEPSEIPASAGTAPPKEPPSLDGITKTNPYR